MARNKPYSGAVLLTMLIALGLTVVMIAACSPIPVSPHPVDILTVAPCPGEAGPGPDRLPAPCVWDAATQGNGQAGPYDVRWTFYADVNGCPDIVQDRRLWHCVPMSDWTGQ
jgi:hypothetical protein